MKNNFLAIIIGACGVVLLTLGIHSLTLTEKVVEGVSGQEPTPTALYISGGIGLLICASAIFFINLSNQGKK